MTAGRRRQKSVQLVALSVVHPLISQSLDRLTIRIACMAQPRAGTYPPRIEEARALLQQPDFFGDAWPAPPNLNWLSRYDFRFSSPVDSPWPETKTVYGRLFRCSEDWVGKPVVVLVHGWNDSLNYRARYMYLARQFTKRGINTAMLELPYHFHRRPRGHNAVKDFISEDLFCTLLAGRQAQADFRAFIGWLNLEGCQRISVWGFSLGGWLSGLITCQDERVCAAILQIPAVRMDQVVQELEFCAPIRRSLEGASLDLSKLNLRSYRPKADHSKILFIEAE